MVWKCDDFKQLYHDETLEEVMPFHSIYSTNLIKSMNG